MKGKIYRIINKINSKIYVGQTKGTLEERFKRHCQATTNKDKYHFNMAIKSAIRKYGKENFTIELLEEVEINKLDEREVYWISFYDSYNLGYNCTLGGQNGATRKCSLNPPKEEEVIQAKLSGFSAKEIGKLYNIDATTVTNIFKRHSLKMPTKYKLEDRISEEEFRAFLNTNPTCKDIEHKFNICKCSVYNYIKNHNIEYNFSKSVQALTCKDEG